jgi:alkanesulfonate monooxygenase SsuD/methylene tetrahydromethanopterin reductase-like flavin-dependent oxidoreductase (luciferase family)
MRVGVCLLPTHRFAEAKARWRAIEAMGFASAWTYDHLTWRHHHDGPWFEAMTSLAAAAAVTDTIRLGTMVSSPNFRHPVVTAKELMTLDDLSGGRFSYGIGAGGTGYDATAFGQAPWPRAERTARFEEFVAHLDTLLSAPATEALEGAFYAARAARCLPGCVQQPRLPFVIAGTGPRALALAARYGAAWVTFGDVARPGELTDEECLATARAQREGLQAACRAIGRDPTGVGAIYLEGQTGEPWLASADAFVELAARYEAAGFTEVIVHWSDEPTVARVLEAIAPGR